MLQMKKGGAKIWYFPDGYLPEKNQDGKMEAHESLMLLNTEETEASVKIDIYYSDRAPVRNILRTLPAERIIVLRTDKSDEIGADIPLLTQYALRITSDTNIVAQFGRLDTTQNNMAYYGCMGYNE
jgi:hypothetical protein